MNPDEPLPTRASLLNRLKDSGDEASWEEFHRTYRGLLVGIARRAGLNSHEADEAVQDTLIAVAAKMPEFRYEAGKDSFKGWLLQIARWKIVDQVRRRSPLRGAVFPEDPTTVAARQAVAEDSGAHFYTIAPKMAALDQDFERIWNEEWERHLVQRALASVKRQARPEHYAIYHLYAIEEQSVDQVCRALGVSTAAVYMAKHRVGSLVKKEILRLRNKESV